MRRLFGAALVALVFAAPGSRAAAPSAGLIAFSLRGADDNDSIYLVRPDGSGLRRLTTPHVRQGYGGDSGPVWSRDGRRIAFARDLPAWGEDRFRVHVVGANGRNERALTSGPFDVMPTWAPDSKRLAFVRLAIGDTESVASIYAVTLRGTIEPLVSGTADVSPAWSPSGDALAFARLVGGTAELFVADATGQRVRDLGIAGTQPAWSPDGRRLAFVSYADGNGRTCVADECAPNGEIYVVAADGTSLRRVTTSKADDGHPTWSPEGRFLAFSSGFEINGHPPWLMVAPAAGGRGRRVTRLAGVHDAAWSPGVVR
jgi:TolB protein